MESPHLYDSEYKKNNNNLINLKVKNPHYTEQVDYSDLNCSNLTNSEISLDLESFIDETQSPQFVSEHLIQELQSLNVDKPSLVNGHGLGGVGPHCPRGIGGNTGEIPPTSNMYNTLAYLPQPVHGGSQFERQYDRLPIKEEPHESNTSSSTRDTPHHQEYPPCARTNYSGGYGGGLSPYPLTPTTVPGVDALLKNPLKSPLGRLGSTPKKSDKSTDEYRRRRERNNIAVRKSREKAKARSRETEERVKLLSDDNKKLHEKCQYLKENLNTYVRFFNSMNVQCLPEPFRSEFRKQMESVEAVTNQYQHNQQLLHGM